MDADPSPKLVLDLLNGFRSSKVLFTLVKLGIPDLLAQQQQHVSLDDLVKLKQLSNSPVCRAAGGAEPSTDGLGRLCDAAVSLGLLGGNRQGYCLTDVTQAYLLSVGEREPAQEGRVSINLIEKHTLELTAQAAVS